MAFFSLISFGRQDLMEWFFLSDVENFLAAEKAAYLEWNFMKAVGFFASAPFKEIVALSALMSWLRSGRVFCR